VVRWLSTNDHEFGIVSVAQVAHGVFAFGQLARGIIAVGQVAIGVVAVGQASFGVFGAGMVGGGVAWFAGIGVGGRGKGLCLRLIPGLDLPRTAPDQVSLADVQQGHTRGFVRLGILATPVGPMLTSGGQTLDIKLVPAVAGALSKALRDGTVSEVFAWLYRDGDSLLCDRLMEVPGQRKPIFPLWVNAMRVFLLVVLATAWCLAFNEFVLGNGK